MKQQSKQHTPPSIYDRRQEFLKQKGSRLKSSIKRKHGQSFKDLFDSSLRRIFEGKIFKLANLKKTT